MHVNLQAQTLYYLDFSNSIRVPNISARRINHGGLPEPLARLPKNNALTRYTREGGVTTNTQRRKVAEGGLTLMTIKGDCPVALWAPPWYTFVDNSRVPCPLCMLSCPHVGGSISIVLTPKRCVDAFTARRKESRNETLSANCLPLFFFARSLKGSRHHSHAALATFPCYDTPERSCIR